MTPLSTAADGLLAGLPVTRLLAEEPDLLRFFANGRLTTLPLDRGTRERVAGVLVRLIPAGRVLSEAEVNQMLNEVYDDHATLRRLMVDSGLLTRAGSADYRRVGAEPAGADSTPERASTRTPAATVHPKNTP
ncbi:DUF2087 domain-containing protein [Phytoactinopolyspora alkaliphila]|uniref:DUF2087 domain-containing protein n=2 Tax=Phytoactinopolyspora alkaliphila TaxID=1783498 RepID=A0A6N9YJE3_9ACTN|nr:DUF2087 domain-containing protein [Phytoactinopolyspora alkaliphila]NED95040.1 DUF2087 domain-containing protein [Phytoactinopolyspora alkaliphila]